MLDQNREYFHIAQDLLGEGNNLIFPFTLYIYNPVSKNYSLFLFANSPLADEKNKFLTFIIDRGGEIAISMRQKRTFLHHTDLQESDVPDLTLQPLNNQPLKAVVNKSDNTGPNKQEELPPYAFKEEFSKAAREENFKPIIDRVRQEVLSLSSRVSPTTSLATCLAEKLLIEDNLTNRIVAVSYMLAKTCDMDDDEALGDLVVGSFLSHIGQTQLDHFYTHKAHMDFTKEEEKQYHRHPGLAHHLIRKSGVDLSDRCKFIIFEHHERWDGKGYPNYKKGSYIQPLALVLGAVAHVFEYSAGKVTGESQPIASTIKNLKDRTLGPGLEFEFGDTIYESIIHLLQTEQVEEAA